jgi:hypothetical protein
MIRLRTILLLCLLIGPNTHAAQAQPAGQAQIISPRAGSSLSGEVVVIGSAAHPTFVSYELAFAYDPDPTDTWFTFWQGAAPVVEGELGRWDTTGISDGAYALRLRVYFSERNFIETIVRGLRLNNLPSVATPTVTPTAMRDAAASPTPTPTLTPTAILLATAAPGLSTGAGGSGGGGELFSALGDPVQIEAAFWAGARLSLAIFGILGLYVFIQTTWRRRRRRTSR